MITSLRLEGLKAIRHFKSDENIALIRSTLTDDTVWGEHIGEGDPPAVPIRDFYPVRTQAPAVSYANAWNGQTMSSPSTRPPWPRWAPRCGQYGSTARRTPDRVR